MPKGKLRAKTTKKRGEKPKTEIVADLRRNYAAFKHGKFTDVPALCKYCQFGGNKEVGGTGQCPKYDPDPEAVCRVREDISRAVAEFNSSNATDLRTLVDIKLKELTVSTTFANLASMWNDGQPNPRDIAALNTWIRLAGLAKDLQPRLSMSKKFESGDTAELSDLVSELFTPAAEAKKDDANTVVSISNG